MRYSFKNESYFHQAMAHPSQDLNREDNQFERMEFLGDRVLGLSIAQLLMELFPHESEGQLARRLAVLASKSTLVMMAKKMGIPEHVKFSRDKGGNRQKNLETVYADACEALIAAVYMDGGFDQAREFVWHYWRQMAGQDVVAPKDVKSALQEWAQSQGKPLPTYEVMGRSGPDHAPTFQVNVFIEGFQPVCGQGSSRKLAEQDAARLFLEGIEE